MLRVAGYIRRSLWLPPENSYLSRTVNKIDAQAVSKPPRFRRRPLTDYIAVSCALHCIDGWSYLARAFSALVQGDSDAARHLAYYAELRAAMGLLASQGTGVFSDRHVIVDQKGACHPFGRLGTHRAAWLFLEYWGERKGAHALLKTVIRPGNRPLGDWIFAAGMGTVTPRLIAQQWCKLWGLDLKRLSKDRDARNESSYRPTQLRNTARVSAIATAEFVTDFWKIFRPWPPNFGILDAHLLRKLWQQTFVASRGVPISDPAFRFQVDQALAKVQPTGMTAAEWVAFLEITTEPPLLVFAAKKDDPTAADHHIQVVSRAALLLRLACGASMSLFESARVHRTELDFWASHFGLMRGIWQDGHQPSDMLDLWVDVEEALEILDSWKAGNGPATPYSVLRRDQVAPLQLLCECERIGLWGVAP
jgi:hypothetical protein